MKSITMKKGETLEQAVQRLNRKMFAEWGRQGGKKGGEKKSRAATIREARKRGIKIFEIVSTIKEVK